MKGENFMEQKKIGSFLKELRKEKGITQEQLAERINVSGRTVSRWETGSNMPDISLLIEIAEFFEVSIPEIINGERKSETMKEEVREVAEKLSDYAGAEKETIIRDIRNPSIMSACALAVCFILEITGASAQNKIFEMISLYCGTLVSVTTILIPLYTTGVLYRIKRKNGREGRFPKPVMMIISAVVAFVAAVVISLLLKMIFG